MATTPAFLIQAQAKKFCCLTQWLLNTQNKLRTAIKGSSTTSTTSSTKKSCSPKSSKAEQQRRIYNEIFGWTSDAWDEMSLTSTSTTTPLFSPAPTTPQTRCISREEALVRADAYTIRRIENAYNHNTAQHPHGRRVYCKVEGY